MTTFCINRNYKGCALPFMPSSCAKCPHRRPRPKDAEGAESPKPPAPPLLRVDFVALWGELHRYALAFSGDKNAAIAWLDAFTSRVPCGSCRRHFRCLRSQLPPDLANANAFFHSTWLWHCIVSLNIEKPIMFLEAARARWA